MKNYGISIYTLNNLNWLYPKIYVNSSLQDMKPFIYTNGAWQAIGNVDTNIIKFITSGGKINSSDTSGNTLDNMPSYLAVYVLKCTA